MHSFQNCTIKITFYKVSIQWRNFIIPSRLLKENFSRIFSLHIFFYKITQFFIISINIIYRLQRILTKDYIRLGVRRTCFGQIIAFLGYQFTICKLSWARKVVLGQCKLLALSWWCSGWERQLWSQLWSKLCEANINFLNCNWLGT